MASDVSQRDAVVPVLPALVVLGAGRASRMGGQPKGLIDAGGSPLVVRHLDAARAAGVSRVVVVLGESAEIYARALPDWPRGGTPPATM